MPSTITIQNVINICSQYTELIPLVGVGGISNEPGLTIANETMAELIGEKHPWKFNRVEMAPLFTMRGRQDYKFAGAAAFGTGDAKGVGIGLASSNAITESSFTVTVNTLESHNFVIGDTFYMTGNTVAAYNSTFTQTPDSSTWSGGWTIASTPTATSFTFLHASSGLANSGAPGINDFGWLESATMIDQASTGTPQTTRNIEAVRSLQPSSVLVRPGKLCVLKDLQTGVLQIRFDCAVAERWQIQMVYQAKPPLKTALTGAVTGDWSPFPDEYAYVYRQMFLAQAYRFASSPRSEVEYQKAQTNVAKALGSVFGSFLGFCHLGVGGKAIGVPFGCFNCVLASCILE